jgi:uncharacterized protein YbcI
MKEFTASMAERVATAAIAFQLERTGHAPSAATVVLSSDTLVITLHGALSEAERVLSKSREGAAQVQAFHRELFGSAAAPLRKRIEQITGMAVREAAGEVEPTTGAVVHAFTGGTMVQVFQMVRTGPTVPLNGVTGDGRN